MGIRAAVFAGLACCATPALGQASSDEDRIAKLEAELGALRAEVAELRKQAAAKPLPSWNAAPTFSDPEGWSFKPRGRFLLDAGYIDPPGALLSRNLGFNSRVRRVRLGAEGTIPGGFVYKVELDLSNAQVSLAEAYVGFNSRSKRVQVRIGNLESFNGLEQISSSNATTFLERAAFDDAFLNTRRLGATVALAGEDALYRLEAGLFAAHSLDASFDNDGWIAAARAVYAPSVGSGRLHLGASIQQREFQSNNSGTASASVNAPSTNQLARYRARPDLQTTDLRFVDTGPFAARRDTILGFELAGVFKPVYFAAEGQWLKARSYRPGAIATGLDAFPANSAVTPLADPGFFGVYGEIGWFITGEARGYGANNVWARTKVLDPVSKGGVGAFQVAARIDYLDLDDRALKAAPTNNFLTGTTSLAALDARLARGGTQTAYAFALNWYPVDYVRLMFNYLHLEIEGGPLAAQVLPLSTRPIDERSYSTDGVAVRAQVEF